MRRAIAERPFDVYYQPILNTRTGAVVAFETLLRWHHPERGLVPPGDFIPPAEETWLIVEIGTWVLGQACRDASTWPSDVKVAVNLSALQVQSPTLMADVAAALAGAALAASRVELEMTETLMLRDTGDTLASLHELRQRHKAVARPGQRWRRRWNTTLTLRDSTSARERPRDIEASTKAPPCAGFGRSFCPLHASSQ